MKSLTRGPNLENAGPKYGFGFPDVSGPPGASLRLPATDRAAWGAIKPGTTGRAQNGTIDMKRLMRGPKPENAGPNNLDLGLQMFLGLLVPFCPSLGPMEPLGGP